MRALFGMLLGMAFVLPLFVEGCFPSKEAISVEPDSLSAGSARISAPTKAYLRDASVILLPDGFQVEGDTLTGTGDRYFIDYHVPDLDIRIPLDSVQAMTYYEKNSSSSSVIASVTTGVLGTVFTPLAIECASCAKCCFGSCPTVYTTGGERYTLEAELFSYSLSRYFQEHDLDLLMQGPLSDGSYRLRLTNEALETHYINQFNLMAVTHPAGSRVYPSDEGGVITTQNLKPPTEAVDYRGHSVLPLVRDRNDQWLRSDSLHLEMLNDPSGRDRVDLSLKLPEYAEKARVVLRLRNTLLTTSLFYDVVLASQGVDALEWTQRLNSDSLYASFYHAIYSSYAGIRVKVKKAEKWVPVASVGDVGPIAWKEIAFEVPVEGLSASGEMLLRLEWFPDNFMIDYIGYEAVNGEEPAVTIQTIEPDSITDFRGRNADEVWQKINGADAEFLITDPGESYYLDYTIPQQGHMSTTLLLQSKGYYTEWLRGNWITSDNDGYRFNLFDVDNTIQQLKESWKENRTIMEKKFFETRIPLKEEL